MSHFITCITATLIYSKQTTPSLGPKMQAKSCHSIPPPIFPASPAKSLPANKVSFPAKISRAISITAPGDVISTQNVDDTVAAFWDYQFLFVSQRSETADTITLRVVDGAVPPDFPCGTYYLTGPGVFTDDHGSTVHPLDGHGYLRAFTIDGVKGVVKFMAKYIKTEAQTEERDPLTGRWRFTHRGPFSVLKGGKMVGNTKVMKNVANTSVLGWGERLFCLWEGGDPYEIDSRSLDTIGKFDVIDDDSDGGGGGDGSGESEMVGELKGGFWDVAATLLKPILYGVFNMPPKRLLSHYKIDAGRDRLLILSCNAEDMLLPCSHFTFYDLEQRQKEHDENVKKVVKRLKQRNPSKDGLVCTARKPWIAVGMRNVDYKRARHFEVDLSAFRNILEIDRERMIARVEPLVNMGQITRVTVPMNLALAVVAELDDLTVRGLINGYGIEGSSHIYGLFADTVVAYEIVLADGQVVRATKDNEYCDLFYAIPWSQGTLGLLVSAEIKLIPIQKEFARRPKAEIPDVNLHEWWEFDSNFKMVQKKEFNIPDHLMIHDWAFTDSHYILFGNRIKLDITGSMAAVFGLSPMISALAVNPSKPTSPIYLLPRSPPNSNELNCGNERDWRVPIEAPSQMWVLHIGNAFENRDDDNTNSQIHIQASVCSYRWFNFQKMFGYDWQSGKLDPSMMNRKEENLLPHLVQVSINLDADGECQECSVKPLNEWNKASDFPVINQDYSGAKNTYIYAATTSGSRQALPHFPFDTVLKLNTLNKSIHTWSVGSRRFIGEPIFVPKGNQEEEDDGYILVVEYAVSTQRCYLVVLSSKKIGKTGALVARLEVPRSLNFPLGFHGFWAPSSTSVFHN
ncbi:unnamed protein product [Camellia sinensis]